MLPALARPRRPSRVRLFACWARYSLPAASPRAASHPASEEAMQEGEKGTRDSIRIRTFCFRWPCVDDAQPRPVWSGLGLAFWGSLQATLLLTRSSMGAESGGGIMEVPK